jgi:hypothetical protein
VFVPTSAALDVAEKVARDLGYAISDKKMYFFDLTTTAEGKAVVPGYVTFGFYGNSNILNQISINESTGQVVDSLNCIVFDFPDLQSFQQELRREAGTQPLSEADLAKSIGCESVERRAKPVRTAKAATSHGPAPTPHKSTPQK